MSGLFFFVFRAAERWLGCVFAPSAAELGGVSAPNAVYVEGASRYAGSCRDSQALFASVRVGAMFVLEFWTPWRRAIRVDCRTGSGRSCVCAAWGNRREPLCCSGTVGGGVGQAPHLRRRPGFCGGFRNHFCNAWPFCPAPGNACFMFYLSARKEDRRKKKTRQSKNRSQDPFRR
jgi:hypothetical protein